MSDILNVALISNEVRVNESLRKIFSSEGLVKDLERQFTIKNYTTLPSVEEIVIHFKPDLIIIHVASNQREEKLTFIDQLSRISNRIPLIVSAASLDADLMLSCVKKGVRDFIKEPYEIAEIRHMLNRLLRDIPALTSERDLGTSYTFFSYKGGIGTTFLACNTAVALARLTHSKVLLWDLVLQNGDVSFFFDYDAQATLTDLTNTNATIDESFLAGVLPVHSTGVTILPGPKRPEEAETIRYDQIQKLHQTLRKHYDHIIIDGGHSLTDQIISAMDLSKYILLTTDLHLPVLKNTLRCIEVFERLGYVGEKFKLILNRFNSKFETFDLVRAEEILKYPIAFSFSNDYMTVSRSLNTGIPLAELDKDCALAREFNEMARLLMTQFVKKGERAAPSLFGGLFKKHPAKKEPPKGKSEEPPPKDKGSEGHVA